MKFYASERLGPKQRVTPEGFLICEAVPIARTGTMIYGDGETPIEVGRDGLARIDRNEDEVFRRETMASFEGKPVTMNHPSEFVGPANWRDLAVGITQNVRRGDGIDAEFLFADLLITDAIAIREVRDGLREVSCGYEADYQPTEPGRGVQRNIVGNHVALVERGRCGPRCAIGDKETTMAKRTVWDRIRTAFRAKDEAALEEALEEAKKTEDEDDDEDKEAKKTSDALAIILKRMDAQDAAIASLKAAKAKDSDDDDDDKKKETEDDGEDDDEDDKKSRTGDSAPVTRATFMDVAARAEILAPGFKVPTFDAKADPKKANDALCGCKRKALDTAYATDDGRKAIEPFLAGRTADFGKMSCAALDSVFVGASELMRQANNARGVRQGITTKDFGRASSVSDINRRNREFWTPQAR